MSETATRVGEAGPLKTVLQPGVYRAMLIEYSGKVWNGRYSFKIIIDVDYGESDPLRLWHFVNSKWMPKLMVANIAGYLAGDNYLQRLDRTVLASSPSVGRSLDKTWCKVELGISSFDNKNEVLAIYPPDEVDDGLKQTTQEVLPIEPQSGERVVLKPIEDDVPF